MNTSMPLSEAGSLPVNLNSKVPNESVLKLESKNPIGRKEPEEGWVSLNKEAPGINSTNTEWAPNLPWVRVWPEVLLVIHPVSESNNVAPVNDPHTGLDTSKSSRNTCPQVHNED